MIAVIADDFTGAAEIGGIALKYGLKVIIETKVKEVSDADLLIIATDTRSMSAEQASSEIKKITKKLIKQKPEYIFKKLDSVLRGNIAHELIAQLNTSEKKRAIVIAGNPIFGRLVNKGVYTINSIPLNKTHFVKDSDFPVSSSSVITIIKKEDFNVVSRSVNEELPSTGLIIGDVTCKADMQNWASKIDSTTIAAGGSGFFDVLLSRDYTKKTNVKSEIVHPGKGTLFVFGSTYPKSSGILERLKGAGVVKKNMPEEIYYQKDYKPEFFDVWTNAVVQCVNEHKKTIVSVDYHNSDEPGLATRIKKTVGKLVKRVMAESDVTDLFIEGGATTSEVLRSLKIAKLYPCKVLDLGIIQMKVDEYPQLCITTKPGSYVWPDAINFDNTEDKIIVKHG